MVGNYGEIIKEALFIPADNQQPAAGKDIHTLR